MISYVLIYEHKTQCDKLNESTQKRSASNFGFVDDLEKKTKYPKTIIFIIICLSFYFDSL